MKIESIIRRDPFTKISFGKTVYEFRPDEQGRQVADVTQAAHIDRLLAIPEGFRELEEGEKIEAQKLQETQEREQREAEEREELEQLGEEAARPFPSVSNDAPFDAEGAKSETEARPFPSQPVEEEIEEAEEPGEDELKAMSKSEVAEVYQAKFNTEAPASATKAKLIEALVSGTAL